MHQLSNGFYWGDEMMKDNLERKEDYFSSGRPLRAVIVGAGHRSLLYASYADRHPDLLQIAGVVDPDPMRRDKTAQKHKIPEEYCFETVEKLIEGPRIADMAINGTMDAIHVETTLPLLRAGYDVLLEKPIGTSKEEVLQLLDVAKKYGRKVMICHVLRYAPFYAEIHKRIEAGEIGDIINIQSSEHVSYHHMAVSYIRGKWGSKEKCKSSMLMAKSCHDLDILTWLKGGIRPNKVSSFGSLMHFKADQAPPGAGKRCLVDCKIEETCPYSARKHYIEQGMWGFYVWYNDHLGVTPSPEQKLELLGLKVPMADASGNATMMWSTINRSPLNSKTVAPRRIIWWAEQPSPAVHCTSSEPREKSPETWNPDISLYGARMRAPDINIPKRKSKWMW
jgi:hypothetical protein